MRSTYSPAALALTKGFEGCRLKAYQDVAGVWTIGYGHTGPGVRAGLVWTQQQADQQLERDLAVYADCVNAAVKVDLTQPQFDALVDFTFNVGTRAFTSSTLLRKLNAGDVAGAAAQFGLWVKAGGKRVEGLARRREAERQMFLGGK